MAKFIEVAPAKSDLVNLRKAIQSVYDNMMREAHSQGADSSEINAGAYNLQDLLGFINVTENGVTFPSDML